MPETSKQLPTRERILLAASKVFTSKGYAATSTRDIATAAGVNISTLHYHHRSKEELFNVVAKQAVERFNTVFDSVISQKKGLRDFLFAFVEGYTELLIDYPYLVGFIQHESERDNETFSKLIDFKAWSIQMADMLAEEPALEGREPYELSGHLIANLVGAMVYPFLFRATTMGEFQMDDKAFEAFVRSRKSIVAEMVATWLEV